MSRNPIQFPAPLALYKSRWTAFFMLPFALVMAICGVGAFFLANAFFEGSLRWAVSAVGAFTCLSLAWTLGRSSVDALTATEPALLVNEAGITDAFQHHVFVPWADIASASVDYGDGSSLVITFRNGAPQAAGGAAVRSGLLRVGVHALRGGDLAIRLTELAYNHTVLKRTLQAYLAKTKSSAIRKSDS